MADVIKLLPDHVANQIAAGEVIQRPASVVKELLENAIDAGADRIQLIITSAGKTLVQVVDNGSGMSATDARMSLERHATSKIGSADDLFSLTTKGFRGEALASIAAISHLEMKTKKEQDEIGNRLLIEGTEVKEQEQIQTGDGTSISVKNLFYNVPARRKFLKSDPVEMRHILDEFHRVALVHIDIQFSLHHNNEEVYNLRKGNFRSRIVDIFGKNFNEKLVPLEEDTTIAKIHGFVGKPEFARRTRGEQFFFVNGRFIKSAYLNHAVNAAYQDLLKEKEYPSFFINIDVDPSFIDINIHPTKTEVKFEDEKSIYAIIRSAVRRSLGQYNIAPAIDFNQEAMNFPAPPKNVHVHQPELRIASPRPKVPDLGALTAQPIKPTRSAVDAWDSLNERLSEKVTAPEPKQTELEVSIALKGVQLLGKYIVSENLNGLILIDHKRAHERVLYEQIIRDLAMNRVPAQQELFPITLELSKVDADLVCDHLDELNRIGVQLEKFGKSAFVVRGLAAFISSSQLSETLDEMIDSIKNSGESTGMKKMEALAKTLAKRSSRRYGVTLSPDEISWLLEELGNCQESNRTPGGLPISIEIDLAQLERMFKKGSV